MLDVQIFLQKLDTIDKISNSLRQELINSQRGVNKPPAIKKNKVNTNEIINKFRSKIKLA